MASSLTAVEANSQEILKSNQLLGIEIRGLAMRIASGLTDLGNQINRDTTRTLETAFEQATAMNGASLQAIVDLLQNRRDVTVDPEPGTNSMPTMSYENSAGMKGVPPQCRREDQSERNPKRESRTPKIFVEETPPRTMRRGESSTSPGPSTSRNTRSLLDKMRCTTENLPSGGEVSGEQSSDSESDSTTNSEERDARHTPDRARGLGKPSREPRGTSTWAKPPGYDWSQLTPGVRAYSTTPSIYTCIYRGFQPHTFTTIYLCRLI